MGVSEERQDTARGAAGAAAPNTGAANGAAGAGVPGAGTAGASAQQGTFPGAGAGNSGAGQNAGANVPPLAGDELSRAIETQVRAAASVLAQSVQTAATSVTDSLQKTWNEQQPLQRMTQTAKMQAELAAERARRAAAQPKVSKSAATSDKCFKKASGSAAAGGSFALVAGIMTAVTVSSAASGGGWPGSLILAVIAAWFAAGSVSSFFKAARLRRLGVYLNCMGERSACTAEQMAAVAGRSVRAVKKDLRRAQTAGQLEGSFLAPDASRLFSSEAAYRMYLSGEQAREETAREETAKESARQEAAAEAQGAPGEHPLLRECRGFAAQLEAQSETLDDAAVNEQVNQLTAHTKRIIGWLEKHPGQEQRVSRFAGYYLPTTLKLLATYEELGPHAVPGSVAAESQEEIRRILSTINTAFGNLEDGLVENTAMSVSAEISALETVLAQEGLTDGGLSAKP